MTGDYNCATVNLGSSADKLKQEETDGPLILHMLTPTPASSLFPCWVATLANVFLIAAALKQMN